MKLDSIRHEGSAKLDNVTRDDWIMGGLALLLAIDLLYWPWLQYTIGAGAITLSVSWSGTAWPSGWLGVLATFCALAILLDLAVQRLWPQMRVPAIGGSRAATRLDLAGAAAGLIALKFLLHINFSRFGWGFYLAVALVAALVYVAVQARHGELG